MAKRSGVRVGDLTDHIGVAGHPILYCRRCGAESSANRGDYFWAKRDYVFKCCGRNMILVTKHTTYRVVTS